MKKPVTCAPCPLYKYSTGMVPDLDQSADLIQLALPTMFAAVLRFPSKDDIANGELMSSKGSRYIEHEFLSPLGVRREQIIFSSVIRCYPHGGEFPTGAVKGPGIKFCRRYDGAIERFDPNLIGITVAPSMILRVPNLATFLRRDIERTVEYARQGYRPLLLMGEEAKELYAPHLDGGIKKWRGHFWEK